MLQESENQIVDSPSRDDGPSEVEVCESEELAVRIALETSAEAAHVQFLVSFLGAWAATDIQRIYRGHIARKRVRVRRKRLLHTVLTLQRISRGGFARRNIKLLRIVLEQPQRRRLVMKYRYLQGGEIVVPRVAAAFILQRFARRIRSIVRVQHLRDLFRYVVRCAVRIQALAKRAQCRRKYGMTLVEQRRARHERLLLDYVERHVTVRRLQRVECQQAHERFERAVCQGMLSGMSYATSLYHADAVQGALRASTGTGLRRPSRHFSREVEYASFMNHRSIASLGDRDTTDSDDDSIDEELLRPQHKAVKLISRRKKRANDVVSTVDSSTNGWLLRAYPGNGVPHPVGKLSRAASALRLARTPSEVARRILVRDDSDDGTGPHKKADVFSRLAHNWLE
jgi:hypothetical protein